MKVFISLRTVNLLKSDRKSADSGLRKQMSYLDHFNMSSSLQEYSNSCREQMLKMHSKEMFEWILTYAIIRPLFKCINYNRIMPFSNKVMKANPREKKKRHKQKEISVNHNYCCRGRHLKIYLWKKKNSRLLLEKWRKRSNKRGAWITKTLFTWSTLRALYRIFGFRFGLASDGKW